MLNTVPMNDRLYRRRFYRLVSKIKLFNIQNHASRKFYQSFSNIYQFLITKIVSVGLESMPIVFERHFATLFGYQINFSTHECLLIVKAQFQIEQKNGQMSIILRKPLYYAIISQV